MKKTNRAFEDRAADLARIANRNAPHSGWSVPRSRRALDLVWEGATPNEVWGPLQGRLVNRAVAIEHCSRRVGLRDTAFSIAKRSIWVAELFDGPKLARSPTLVILAESTAQRATRTADYRAFSPGLSESPGGFPVKVYIVELARVSESETGLRMFVPPRDCSQHRLRSFLRDVAIPPDSRQLLR
ncbi:MAG: hypothetical protein ACJAYU_001862 [Bradymonadia bacterium]|jgi:hypothetical protein